MNFRRWWSEYSDSQGLFDVPEVEARHAWNAALHEAMIDLMKRKACVIGNDAFATGRESGFEDATRALREMIAPDK